MKSEDTHTYLVQIKSVSVFFLDYEIYFYNIESYLTVISYSLYLLAILKTIFPSVSCALSMIGKTVGKGMAHHLDMFNFPPTTY